MADQRGQRSNIGAARSEATVLVSLVRGSPVGEIQAHHIGWVIRARLLARSGTILPDGRRLRSFARRARSARTLLGELCQIERKILCQIIRKVTPTVVHRTARRASAVSSAHGAIYRDCALSLTSSNDFLNRLSCAWWAATHTRSR